MTCRLLYFHKLDHFVMSILSFPPLYNTLFFSTPVISFQMIIIMMVTLQVLGWQWQLFLLTYLHHVFHFIIVVIIIFFHFVHVILSDLPQQPLCFYFHPQSLLLFTPKKNHFKLRAEIFTLIVLLVNIFNQIENECHLQAMYNNQQPFFPIQNTLMPLHHYYYISSLF